MFNKSLGEILEIMGTVCAWGILIIGSVWVLLKSLNINLTDIFNNITLPS